MSSFRLQKQITSAEIGAISESVLHSRCLSESQAPFHG